MEQNRFDLTTGSVKKAMLKFTLPYLLSCFLQTFYGLADLFIVGLFNGSETSTAVSIGSQIIHMLTVMIAGLAMGSTVEIARSIGGKVYDRAKKVIGTSVVFFALLAAVSTLLLTCLTKQIVAVMSTPVEAVSETVRYVFICFLGLPFIIAYNLISSIYRGAGDSRSPMIFVLIACVVNIIADFIFIGICKMGAAGAALGTVIGQGVSVLFSLLFLKKVGLGFTFKLRDIRFYSVETAEILKVGFPISIQDGLIQIAFIVITVIANTRGLIDSVSVGVVEKIISFLFLVPSAFLSAISAFTAQNMGAGKPERARQSLGFGLIVTMSWGLLCFVYCQFWPESLIGLFRREQEILTAGAAYLRSYSLDCIFAAAHFCFSGYFCGIKKSWVSFLHNILSVVLVRVPGAYFASLFFKNTLFPMGLAAPCGSFLSILICLGFYFYFRNKEKNQASI